MDVQAANCTTLFKSLSLIKQGLSLCVPFTHKISHTTISHTKSPTPALNTEPSRTQKGFKSCCQGVTPGKVFEHDEDTDLGYACHIFICR